ncbi:hypothetical protein CAPTEDRAFT_178029 [Capitella teleta]|uniref:Ras-related protein Rab-23 n=1 Tax=Capitella teleta TaxID=283909 RepID=R7T8V0_CAPTE|nr:hypothetical protein CAPTEDRAFT_178029 [Capitella teleta]|eukprot:ELT90055.1 hypothetical protein CAPTEDRAFT_178029 [Capitella teleta]
MTGDMREEEVETAIKVVIVGNGAVGKSSMIQRYCKGIFTKDYKKTIGVDFLERQIEVNCEDVRLMLWDTAGQEEFDAITRAYYRGAQACVIAFSIVDRDSFEAIQDWKRKVEDEVGQIPTVFVQNKMDLADETLVAQKEVDDLVANSRLKLFKTSVKNNVCVDDVFKYLAEKYLEQLDERFEEQPTSPKIGAMDMFKIQPNNGKSQEMKKLDTSTIQLQPSKRRTKGKKHSLSLKKCVIL